MSETILGLGIKYLKWKEAFESKGVTGNGNGQLQHYKGWIV